MNIKKSLLVAGAAATIGVAGIGGLGVASAATEPTTDGHTSLITKLAQKFNLKEADVAAVFDEDRAAHEADMKQRMEDRLARAVSDGDITQAQKDAILAKLAQLKSEREADRDSMKVKTAAERKALMEQHRSELSAWATQNDIPLRYLRIGMGGHHGPGGPMMDAPDTHNSAN